jgi:thiol-disulfide isomerase/thioredoxin
MNYADNSSCQSLVLGFIVATFSDSDANEPRDEPTRRRRGNLVAWLIFAAAALVIGLVFQLSNKDDSGPSHPAVGRRLPQLELKPLTGDGRPISLADLEGRVTLIDFWGTWCPPCAEELPHIAALAAKYAGQPNFQVLAVSCGPDNRNEDLAQITEQTDAFLHNFKINLPTYADPGSVSRRGVDLIAGFVGYPTTVILDRRGVIRGMWVGYRAGYERQIEKLVADLLDEPKVP